MNAANKKQLAEALRRLRALMKFATKQIDVKSRQYYAARYRNIFADLGRERTRP